MIAFLPVLALVAWRWTDGFGVTAGDWAHYLLHARAIVEHRAYGDIGYLYTQYNPWVGPPSEPPGLPLTLAPLLALFGPNLAMIHVVMVLSLLVGLVMVWRYFAPREGAWPAAAIVAFSGVALVAASAVNNIMADIGFFALLWAVMVVADAPGALSWRRVALLTVLGASAVAYRTAGVALAPALLVYAVVARKPRAVVPVAIWGVLGLAALARMRTGVNVLSTISLHPGAMVRTALSNAQVYLVGAMVAFLRPLPWAIAAKVYHLLAALIALVGAVALLRSDSRRSFAVVFAVVYVGMLLAVPVVESRYLWPLFPLLAACLVHGARLIAGRVALAGPAPRLAGAAAVVVGAAIVLEGVAPRKPMVTDIPTVQQVIAVADSLHRTEDARFVFANPRVLTWRTGAPAMVLFAAPPAATMQELRRGRVTHVVLGDFGDLVPQDSSMKAAIAANPGAFRLEYRNPGFAVYRLLPDSATAR